MRSTKLSGGSRASALRNERLLQRRSVWVVAVTFMAFAGLGGLMNMAGRANPAIKSSEIESGSLTGKTAVIKTKNASGGKAVALGIEKSTTQRNIAEVDGTVKSFMSKYSIPGASIAITKNDQLVYAKSYGQIGATDKTPVNNNNLFRIASDSKPITSVGIMKLIEAGKLTTSSKVFGPGGILDTEYPKAPSATYDITINNLLQHTVGVWGNDGNDPMFQHLDYNHQQLITWALATYPADHNRGKFSYSNFGYSILGRVIEKLSGKPYDQYIKDSVLKPSGITDMQIAGNTQVARKPNEVLYKGQQGNDPYSMNVTRMDSHGGWLATATDMARFLVHVDGFSGVKDILKSATIKTMTAPNTNNYADGWGVNSEGNWWHTGALPGTATEIIRGANGFNMVILLNSRSYDSNFDADLDNLLWPVVNNKATPWQEINQF